jgi:hypothetical protein
MRGNTCKTNMNGEDLASENMRLCTFTSGSINEKVAENFEIMFAAFMCKKFASS